MHPNTLADAVANAITFLTRPLILAYPPATLTKLQSDARRIRLSTQDLPAPIHRACLATGIQWADWMSLLGGRPFDLHVDPGCVYMRESTRSGETRLVTIWSASNAAPVASHKHSRSKTVAQIYIAHDREEEDRIFAQLAHEVDEPCWVTPVVPHFPADARSISPLSTSSAHSRSSSHSSDSSYSVPSTHSSSSSASGSPKQSRRERAREGRVYVDTSKAEVTVYEAACTTVLSGGTMLGKKAPKRRA
ncbi:hypothetical protein DL96DRAFT_1574147 [Flagelloscypha sp. PMI_526]|nr:hypothetical protein DL96DRAFT_1574147 [Flagelloscypha sp. PMI_526]